MGPRFRGDDKLETRAMSKTNGKGPTNGPDRASAHAHDHKGQAQHRHHQAGIAFTLDGREVEAHGGETIWQVAQRQGVEIPHLSYTPAPGYRPDGNCRACMVEIEGERVLAASCIRKPSAGMKVKVASARAKAARRTVFELLIADQPERATAPDPQSK